MPHPVKAQFPSQLFEIQVVALGQRVGHVHAEARQLHHRVPRHQSLRQRRHGHGDLDRRARLSARRERKLLVHHRQDPPVRRVNDHGRPVHVAHRVNRRLADHWILAGRYIACKDISAGKGVGRKPLVGMMVARSKSSPARTCPGLASGGQMSRLTSRRRLCRRIVCRGMAR